MVHIIRKIKRLFALFIALIPLCAALSAPAYAAAAPSVSAKSAIVMSNGYPVYEKDADTPLPIASTTKLMTAILVIENCALDERVDIKAEYCGIEGSSMYLAAGECYTVRELLLGLLLVSGNDAAVALACHAAGDCAAFAARMNDMAVRLGMDSTHFTNPHGLYDKAHYSTARDMARLMEYCMDNPAFAELDSAPSCDVGGKTLINHNRLLQACPGCIGGKTGFTEAAGRCLVSCCERDGARLVCVTLGAQDDWNDHMRLYSWAYSECSARSVTDGVQFAVPLIAGDRRWAYLVPEGDVSLFIPREAKVTLRAELPWFEFAPISAGVRRGRVYVSVDEWPVLDYYLVYKETAETCFAGWN